MPLKRYVTAKNRNLKDAVRTSSITRIGIASESLDKIDIYLNVITVVWMSGVSVRGHRLRLCHPEPNIDDCKIKATSSGALIETVSRETQASACPKGNGTKTAAFGAKA